MIVWHMVIRSREISEEWRRVNGGSVWPRFRPRTCEGSYQLRLCYLSIMLTAFAMFLSEDLVLLVVVSEHAAH
eukprot:COSAG02_NODE_7256_length_3094_cov_19.263773_2_plen_73_part_00